MSVVLEFPPPTHPLSENEKRKMSHWAQYRRRLTPWFEATQWAWKLCKNQRDVIGRKCVVFVEIPFLKAARRDPHNYVGTNVKSIVDALTTKTDRATGEIIWQGAWLDDNPEWVTVEEPRLVIGEVVRVHLTPVEE
jgi:hypothetical protein